MSRRVTSIPTPLDLSEELRTEIADVRTGFREIVDVVTESGKVDTLEVASARLERISTIVRIHHPRGPVPRQLELRKAAEAEIAKLGYLFHEIMRLSQPDDRYARIQALAEQGLEQIATYNEKRVRRKREAIGETDF